MSTMKEKMHTGELYLPGDEEITARQLKCLDKLYDFNMTRPTELEKREEMLKEMHDSSDYSIYLDGDKLNVYTGGRKPIVFIYENGVFNGIFRDKSVS